MVPPLRDPARGVVPRARARKSRVTSASASGRRDDRFCLAVDRFGVWRGSRLSGCVGGVDFVVAAWVA